MQLLTAYLAAIVLIPIWLEAMQISLEKLPLGSWPILSICETDLGAYLDDPAAPPCLPPRSDHGAPGQKRSQAAAAICLLASALGLPGDTLYAPFPIPSAASSLFASFNPSEGRTLSCD